MRHKPARLGLVVAAIAALSLLLLREVRSTAGGARAVATGRGESDAVRHEREGLATPDGVGVSRVAQSVADSRQTRQTGSPTEADRSLADDLLAELRRLAEHADYHARAWECVVPAAEEILALDATERARELGVLERAAGSLPEHELVRGACLLALALASAGDWYEERFPVPPAATPEIERAAWLADALRRRGAKGMEVPVGDYRPWTKLATYPVVANRRADPAELAAGRARMRELLPPEFYENGGRGTPEARQENLVREVVLLVTLGPGADEPSEEREELLALLTPDNAEEWFLARAASFVLALAAREDDELARRMLQSAFRAEGHASRLAVLEHLAAQGKTALVAEALTSLFHEDGGEDVEVMLHQTIATELVRELAGSESAEIRDVARSIALEGALDPARDAHQRWLLLSALDVCDPAAYADVLSLVVQSESDPELLMLLSASLEHDSAHDRTLAVQLFGQILDKELPSESQRFVLQQIALWGGVEAGELLRAFAARTEDESLRSFVAELIEGAG